MAGGDRESEVVVDDLLRESGVVATRGVGIFASNYFPDNNTYYCLNKIEINTYINIKMDRDIDTERMKIDNIDIYIDTKTPNIAMLGKHSL